MKQGLVPPHISNRETAKKSQCWQETKQEKISMKMFSLSFLPSKDIFSIESQDT